MYILLYLHFFYSIYIYFVLFSFLILLPHPFFLCCFSTFLLHGLIIRWCSAFFFGDASQQHIDTAPLYRGGTEWVHISGSGAGAGSLTPA
jgi:hypothetical protein